MDHAPGFPEAVTGSLNFAADRSFGGEFSNSAPELSRQNLQLVEVEIRNMRGMAHRPTLAAEGLTFAPHSSGVADWSNDEWIQSEYIPSCVELVKSLTGAKAARYRCTPRSCGGTSRT